MSEKTPDSDPGSHDTGDDRSTAGEYRDADLSRLFDADPVPQHHQDFWSTLRSEMGPGAETFEPIPVTGPVPAGLPSDPTTPLQIVAEHDPSTRSEQRARPGSSVEDPTALLDVVPIARRRRSLLPVLVAAASIAVVGLGVAAIVVASNDGTTLDSGPADSGNVTVAEDGDSSGTTVPEGTESEADDTTSDGETSDGEPETVELPALPVDYFANPAVASIGDGRIVMFSPDETSVLVIADTAGTELGCEGAPLLDLYVHSLTTGLRQRALPEGMTVETGGLELTSTEDNGDGTRTVAWTEYCDGFISSMRTARLMASGAIDQVSNVEVDQQDSPAPRDFGAQSDDGRAVLRIDDNDVAEVRLAGIDDPDQVWRLEGVRVSGFGSFDPTGQVVALPGPDVVHLWEFRTNRLTTVPVVGAFDTGFSPSGELLRVESFDQAQGATLVVFDDRALPVTAEALETVETDPATCSGAIELPPLSADQLTAAGVPVAAAEKAALIDAAAATCDWTALDTLAAIGFQTSFGGGAVGLLTEREDQGSGVMDTLRLVLRQPFGTEQPEGGPDIYAWPEAFTKLCEDYTAEDRQSLLDLGYTEEQIAGECDGFGSYLGWRAGITAGGDWLYFIAGD